MTKYGGSTTSPTANVLQDLPIRTMYQPGHVTIAAINRAYQTDGAAAAVKATFKSGDVTLMSNVPVPEPVSAGAGTPLSDLVLAPVVIYSAEIDPGTLVLTFAGASPTNIVDWVVMVG